MNILNGMNKSEAMKATETSYEIIVETKSGAQYIIGRDNLETYDDFLYGYRINASMSARFKRGRGAQNGDVRWFYLKNVKLIGPA